MNELVWFRAYVGQLLLEIWDLDELDTDRDGDYPSRYGTAAVWVRAEGGSPMALRVFAHAAHGVKRSARLLAELNEITGRSRFGSVYWADGTVMSEYSLPASAVDEASLAGAYLMVANRADSVGVMVSTVYGGSTPYEPEPAYGTATEDDAA